MQVSDTQYWLSRVQLGNAPPGALGHHKFCITDISQQVPFFSQSFSACPVFAKIPCAKTSRLPAEKRTRELCLKRRLSVLRILQMTHKSEGISESIRHVHSRTLILL